MNAFLFVICALIWGSTWIAINFQIDTVEPAVAVAWRFTIAAICLGIWGLVRRRSFMLPLRVHKGAFIVGLLLYTLDYTFLYAAQQHILSAILAVLSSSVIYFTILWRWLLLNKPIRKEVLLGATLGLIGTIAIFLPELNKVSLEQGLSLGLLFALCSFLSASLGNIVSEKTLIKGTSVSQFNFFAMTYSLLFIYSFGFITHKSYSFPDSTSFYISLVYLAVFGSVFAFGAYMKLLQHIGSDRATYVVLVYPIVALLISTFFESYTWSLVSLTGIVIVLIGNVIAMGKLNNFLSKYVKIAPQP